VATDESLPESLGPKAGYRAPGFAVPGLTGGQVTLAQYAGRPRVVSFFASWCEECWNDMAVLQHAYDRYRDQGLVILGIGVHDSVGSLRRMTERVRVTFPTGYDAGDDLAARRFNLCSIPTTVFVGTEGIIKGVVQGRVHSDTLRQYLALILPSAASTQ
jgi:peroxiredoxin